MKRITVTLQFFKYMYCIAIAIGQTRPSVMTFCLLHSFIVL